MTCRWAKIWPVDKIKALKAKIESHGMAFEVIESVPVHEDIKLGKPSRDRLIANYQQTIRNLGQCGLKVICYNFMPVFDWTRTTLEKVLPDGSDHPGLRHQGGRRDRHQQGHFPARLGHQLQARRTEKPAWPNMPISAKRRCGTIWAIS